MFNALQQVHSMDMGERQLAAQSRSEERANRLMQFNMQQAAERNAMARAQMEMQRYGMSQKNMLAQQMLGSRERMMADRIRSQEMMARERANQPIWDAERGVFVQRPQMGQGGVTPGAAGVFAPPGLPPRKNPEAEKLQAKAAAELPTALDQGQMALKQIDDLIAHPGFENAVGMPNVITGLGARVMPGLFPGSDTASFNKRLDQIKGGAFLQAFESLKGGGQITEVEGKKATEAITRMDTAQSEKEFVTAARELQDIIRKGMENAKKMGAGGNKPGAPAGLPSMDAIDAEIRRRQGR